MRDLCVNEKKAIDELGIPAAKLLRHRLADIRAADTVNELLVGNPRLSDNKKHNSYVIDLLDDACLMFCANHNNNPTTLSNTVDWTKVSRIKVTKIGACHV